MNRAILRICLVATTLSVAGLIGCDTDDKSCEFMGQTYPFDSVFQAGDGCNICHCGDDDGRPWVECTLVACLPDAGSVIDAAVPDASMTDAPDASMTDAPDASMTDAPDASMTDAPPDGPSNS